jgi:uncharacterized protein RhaS with RHS repeats
MGANRSRLESSALALAIAGVPLSASAGETITYSYDALGRLVEVARSGGPTNGGSDYQYDKAGNRTRVISSAQNLPGPRPTPAPGPTEVSSFQVAYNGRFVLQRKP